MQIRKTHRNTLKILLLATGLIQTQNVAAGYAIRANEVLLLPPSCYHLSKGNFEPDAYKLIATKPKGPALGPHMQHFCHGKKSVIRGSLQTAIREFDYVLSNTQDKTGRYNTYLAITHIEKARVLQKMNMRLEAMQNYQKAISYNPKLSQAYAGLSDLYKTQGMNDEARNILEQGLKQVPKSKSLQRRLSKLTPESE